MSNFNNIRKNAYEMGILLDGCGTDERYYTFGAYVDLCGATPEELMPKCCDGSSTGDTGTTTTNIISTSIAKNGNTWQATVTSQKTVASDIQVSVKYTYTTDKEESKSITEILLLENNTSTGIYSLNVPDNTIEVIIDNITLSPTSDDDYKYVTETTNTYKLFYGVFPIKSTSAITASDIENMNSIITKKGENKISFNIPAIGIEGLNDMEDEEEVNKILKENAYDLIIAYDAKIKNYDIIDLFGEIDKKFIFNKKMTINKTEYSLIVRSDPDTQRNVYDTAVGPTPFAPIEYSFNIK